MYSRSKQKAASFAIARLGRQNEVGQMEDRQTRPENIFFQKIFGDFFKAQSAYLCNS